METWQPATAIFFIYVAAVAAWQPGLTRGRRALAFAGAAAGIGAAAGTVAVPQPVFNDWIVPPLVLLVAYWTTGLLYVSPMPRVEAALMGVDRALAIRQLAGASPRVLAELLECAYLAVYPVVPMALAIQLTAAGARDAQAFWTVILVTDYICFGMLPWIQTRPPRLLEEGEPWHARVRTLNLRLLGHTSIKVNTFPSGHAAEALAAALLVAGAPAAVFAAMLLVALAISAGAALGRYHYAADVFAGWIVAVVVWGAVM
jgi:hypothetical protein